MKLTVLGPNGGELPGCRSTCFLLDGVFAVDAGALTSALLLDELAKVEDILLTHSHFDHVKDLPMLADVLVGRRRRPVRIHSNRGCIKALREHLFNDVLWPDFTEIPTRQAPVFQLKPFKAGAAVKIGRYRVQSVPVTHPVESCGYIISDGRSTLAISGDTGPTEAFWKVVNETRGLKLLLLETSFPNSLQRLADISGHLTPRTMEAELAKLRHEGVEVALYHLKPAFVDQIKREVRHLRARGVRALELGDTFEL